MLEFLKCKIHQHHSRKSALDWLTVMAGKHQHFYTHLL